MTDMRTTQSEKKQQLKGLLKETTLTKEEKKLIKTAMEFGYASAYCARTCDMSQSFYAAGNYEDDYKSILKEI